jgi:hypothetical protein
MSRVLIIAVICLATAALALTPAEFGELIEADLAEKGLDSTQLIEVLKVSGIGAGQRDWLLAGVTRGSKLVAVYYQDLQRDSVKAIFSTVTLAEFEPGLFASNGVNDFAARKRLKRGSGRLISLGPASFFGSIGVGWYVQTPGDFYLLSLRGEEMPGKMARKFFPQLTDSLGQAQLKQALKPATDSN